MNLPYYNEIDQDSVPQTVGTEENLALFWADRHTLGLTLIRLA